MLTNLGETNYTNDLPRVSSVADELLTTALYALSKARLLSAPPPPRRNLVPGCMPTSYIPGQNNTIGLRLGATLCIITFVITMDHVWTDTLGTHELSCHLSAGHQFHNAMLNDILRRALSSVNIPSWLESTSLDRADGMHPDGITMVPWLHGRRLVCDATCVDIFATFHVSSSCHTHVQHCLISLHLQCLVAQRVCRIMKGHCTIAITSCDIAITMGHWLVSLYNDMLAVIK